MFFGPGPRMAISDASPLICAPQLKGFVFYALLHNFNLGGRYRNPILTYVYVTLHQIYVNLYKL